MTKKHASSRSLRRLDGEHGAIAVIGAIVLLVLFALGTLTVDLGLSYADRRQGQNAADAAAVAATNQLVKARYTTGGTGSFILNTSAAAQLDTVAVDTLVANGAMPTDYTCEVVDTTGAAITSCSNFTGWMSITEEPVGVRVVAKTTRSSVLAQASAGLLGSNGPESLATTTNAAARVSPIKAGGGPFVVCAYSQQDSSGDPVPNLLVPLVTTPPPYTGVTFAINPAAIGQEYNVHGPKAVDCNLQGEEFKGNTDEEGFVTLPGWINTDEGTKAGPARTEVAGACSSTKAVGCILTLPICVYPQGDGKGASKQELYCVTWGAFELTDVKPNEHSGVLLGERTVSGAVPLGGIPIANTPRVITLVE